MIKVRGFKATLPQNNNTVAFFWLQSECKFHVFIVIFIESMFTQPWHMARAPY